MADKVEKARKKAPKADKKTEAKKPLSLEEQLMLKRQELLVARQSLGLTLQNPHAINTIRKDIARLLTQINATKGDN